MAPVTPDDAPIGSVIIDPASLPGATTPGPRSRALKLAMEGYYRGGLDALDSLADLLTEGGILHGETMTSAQVRDVVKVCRASMVASERERLCAIATDPAGSLTSQTGGPQ